MKEDFDWGNLWADLLKGAGTGLLTYDGSRAAQAALAGLDVFDAAQERRRQASRQEADDSPLQEMLLKLRSTLSPDQWAALLRLPPHEQNAWAEEWTHALADDAPRAEYANPANGEVQQPVTPGPSSRAGRPIPVNPLDGWHLQSILPFGSAGGLNRPTYRR